MIFCLPTFNISFLLQNNLYEFNMIILTNPYIVLFTQFDISKAFNRNIKIGFKSSNYC